MNTHLKHKESTKILRKSFILTALIACSPLFCADFMEDIQMNPSLGDMSKKLEEMAQEQDKVLLEKGRYATLEDYSSALSSNLVILERLVNPDHMRIKKTMLLMEHIIKLKKEEAEARDYKQVIKLYSRYIPYLENPAKYEEKIALSLELLLEKNGFYVSLYEDYEVIINFYGRSLKNTTHGTAKADIFEKQISLSKAYFEKAGQNPHTTIYESAAMAYHGVAVYSRSLDRAAHCAQESIRMWENYLSRTDQHLRVNKYNMISLAYLIKSKRLTENLEELSCYENAFEYFENIPQKADQEHKHLLKDIIFAYAKASMLVDQKQKKRQFIQRSIDLSQIILKKDPSKEAVNNVIFAYERAKDYETDLVKKREYAKTLQTLYTRLSIAQIFSVGNAVISFTQAELDQIKTIAPLEVTLSPDEEDEAPVEQTPEGPSKSQIKRQKEKARKADRNPLEKPLEEESKMSTQEQPQELELEQDTSLLDEPANAEQPPIQGSLEPTPCVKLTKPEKKQQKLLSETAQRKAQAPETMPTQTPLSITIDPKTKMSIFKAYESTEERQKIFGLFHDIEACKGRKLTDTDVEKYMKKMAFFFNGEKLRDTKEGPLYQIFNLHFGYAPAHGSRGGEWDKKMIKRFVNFGKNIQTIFEAIMGTNG